MASIAVYFDDFFNETNNYVSYSVSEIVVDEHMSYTELSNVLRSKLGSFIDMNNFEIYLCLGPIECLKKDLGIKNDNNVKWVYHIITSNVEQHIALIVHCVGVLAISLGSSSSSSFQTEIHSDGGRFFETIHMSKIVSNFSLKNQDMFSTKSLLKQFVQAIALRDNSQYVTIKSNKQVLIM